MPRPASVGTWGPSRPVRRLRSTSERCSFSSVVGSAESTVQTLTVRSAALGDAPRLVELSAELGYPTSLEAMSQRLDHLLRQENDNVLVATSAAGLVVG